MCAGNFTLKTLEIKCPGLPLKPGTGNIKRDKSEKRKFENFNHRKFINHRQVIMKQAYRRIVNDTSKAGDFKSNYQWEKQVLNRRQEAGFNLKKKNAYARII